MEDTNEMGALDMKEDYKLEVHSLENSDLKLITLILLLIPELGGCRDKPGLGPLHVVPRLALSWEGLLFF